MIIIQPPGWRQPLLTGDWDAGSESSRQGGLGLKRSRKFPFASLLLRLPGWALRCNLCHAHISHGMSALLWFTVTVWITVYPRDLQPPAWLLTLFPCLTGKKQNKFGVAFPPHAGTTWRRKSELSGWRTQQAPHWPASVCLSGWLTGFVKGFARC